jgi:hypothetical protein
MDTSQLNDLGGGLTIVSLLSILIHNFLVRKREDSTVIEKVGQLNGQLAKLDQQQSELIRLYTRMVEQSSLLIAHQCHKSDR